MERKRAFASLQVLLRIVEHSYCHTLRVKLYKKMSIFFIEGQISRLRQVWKGQAKGRKSGILRCCIGVRNEAYS